MKKLLIAAMALSLSAGVSANTDAPAPGGMGAQGLGALTISTLTSMGIAASVIAAIVANNKSVTIIDGQKFDLICNPIDPAPVDGVCTTVGNVITVTGTGTNTSTISVPVTSTYPAIIVPRTP